MRRQEESWCQATSHGYILSFHVPFRISQENEKTAVSSCQLCEYVLITHDNFTDLGSAILLGSLCTAPLCTDTDDDLPTGGIGSSATLRSRSNPGCSVDGWNVGEGDSFGQGRFAGLFWATVGISAWEPWRLCRDSTKMHKVCTDDLRTVTCAFCKSATIVAELSLSRIQTAKLPGLGTLVDL